MSIYTFSFEVRRVYLVDTGISAGDFFSQLRYEAQTMIARALSSATTSLAVTTGLLYVMQFLIATGEEIIIEPRQMHEPEWLSPPEPPATIVEPPPPRKIDEPPLPPKTNFPDMTEIGGTGIGIPPPPPTPPTGRPTISGLGTGDGPLINIIKVQPQYPAAAASKGLGGTVVVQYNVTALGAVENVVVVESTNKLFNKSAIAAAYRFKYKPKIVDGIPYGVKGLQQLFRFELEQ